MVPPKVNMNQMLGNLAKTRYIRLEALLDEELGFKIPVLDHTLVNDYPKFFAYGKAEYGVAVDSFLGYHVISNTSETSTVVLDAQWTAVLEAVCALDIRLNEHDGSSQARLRPDMAGVTTNNILVIKGESKADRGDLSKAAKELVSKFHRTAYNMFPKESAMIPAVASAINRACLYGIVYHNGKFQIAELCVYNLQQVDERIRFIQDIFRIAR